MLTIMISKRCLLTVSKDFVYGKASAHAHALIPMHLTAEHPVVAGPTRLHNDSGSNSTVNEQEDDVPPYIVVRAPHHEDSNTFDTCRAAGHDVFCCHFGADQNGHIMGPDGHWGDDAACVRSECISGRAPPPRAQTHTDMRAADEHRPCGDYNEKHTKGPYCCDHVHDFSKTGDEKTLSCAKIGIGPSDEEFEEDAKHDGKNRTKGH